MVVQKVPTIYLNLFDEITMPKVQAIMATCADLYARHKPDTLHFLISSTGGQVIAGITLHNYLKALPVKVVMHNIGNIDSIAVIVFLAGEERYASHGTSFLFHGVSIMLPAQARLTSAGLSEIHSQVREDEKKISAIVTRHTSITSTELRELFKQGESKDLDFATEKGFIQGIRDAQIPRDQPFLTFKL
ncbi:MAG: ATP-dependent Clp protease proteolytic subunit [Flavobacteriales bacterium]|nr:ATP-dependent Clp protease proteolytic subunit [Flavobacteriales bacterium]